MQINSFIQSVGDFFRGVPKTVQAKDKGEADLLSAPPKDGFQASAHHSRGVDCKCQGRDFVPDISIEEASSRIAFAYAGGKVGAHSWSDPERDALFDQLGSAHRGDKNAEALVSMARRNSALAPAAVGALFPQSPKEDLLAVGLASVARWDSDKCGKDKFFPTEQARHFIAQVVERTGDLSLKNAALDSTPENLKAVSEEILQANGTNSLEVLKKSVAPLVEGIIDHALQPGALAKGVDYMQIAVPYRRLDVFPMYTQKIKEGEPGFGLYSFLNSHTVPGKSTHELWPEAKGELASSLPSIERGIEKSRAQIRAKAALDAPLQNVYPDGGEPYDTALEKLSNMNLDARQNSLLSLPKKDSSPGYNSPLARAVLVEIAEGGPAEDSFQTLSRTALRTFAATDPPQRFKISDPLPISTRARAQGEILQEAMLKASSSDFQGAILQECLTERPLDALVGPATYFAKERDDSPKEAALKMALVASQGSKAAPGFLKVFSETTDEPLERAVSGLFEKEDSSFCSERASVPAALLYAQKLEPGEKETFLRRVGLQLVAGERNPENLDKAVDLLRNLDVSIPPSPSLAWAQAEASTAVLQDGEYEYDFIRHVAEAKNQAEAVQAELSSDYVALRGRAGHTSFPTIKSLLYISDDLFQTEQVRDKDFKKAWNGEAIQLELVTDK